MAISDWSSTAASNTTVGTVNIAENCSPGGINDAIREVMANVRSWYGGFSSFVLSIIGSADAAAFRTAIGASASSEAVPPPGAVIHFARETPPTGWLECSGTAVSRTTYASLFSAIGTVFGAGNGTTTFNVPDLRGEFIRGYDHGRGVDVGRANGSSQAAMVGTHNHTLSLNTRAGNYATANPSPGWGGDDAQTGPYTATTANNSGTETRPRNVALLPCIKY